MLIDETILNIERTVAHLAAKKRKPATRPHLIAAPKWFRDLLHETYAKANEVSVEELGEVESIHGALVVAKDDIAEPVLVTPGGKVHQILPVWARAKTIAGGGQKPQLILLK